MKIKTFNKNQKDTLTSEEVKYYRDRFNKYLIVGTELETQNQVRGQRQKMEKLLNPTGNYWSIPDNGVMGVIQDYSIKSEGGCEIIMAGDSCSFEETVKRYEYVENLLKQEGFYVDDKCGQHTSVLTSKPFRIKGIIFKNIFQLVKLYAPEIARLTSCGLAPSETLSLTIEQAKANYKQHTAIRSNAKRFANWNFNNTTAIGKTCEQIIKSGMEENQQGGKYGFFNMYKTNTIPNSDDIGDLFVEFRIPDRCVNPVITASWNFFFKAIVLKAVTLSEFGLLSFDNATWTSNKQKLGKLFDLPMETIAKDMELDENCHELVDYLSEELKYMGATSAYDTLTFLIDNPIWGKNNFSFLDEKNYDSIKHGDYKTNYLINPALYLKHVIAKISDNKESPNKLLVKENLTLGVQAKSENELLNFLAKKLNVKPTTIKTYIGDFTDKKLVKTKRTFYLN